MQRGSREGPTLEPTEKVRKAGRQTGKPTQKEGVTDRQTERTRNSAVPPKTKKPNHSHFHYTSLHIKTSPSLGAYDPQEGIHTASNRQIDSLLHLTFDESRSTYTYALLAPAHCYQATSHHLRL
ncbi:hypothetical protein MGYG_09117 [Nannizzia gypsea CBS 118893]|uniref:Uncharacterized protein n=1 Tax=Arthroderma gypseum (strain ATCC MYA-4604 / CBS 118893) TaxID=535722 RepID=E4UYW8_ARTGP|nr:hypothetical protein MGYG_09117 [Nannizzia gypsea CBS 118893]EFR03298.1 hypothetical protein MGYG_09117 [Nannizzia gypsea CBS 118893]